MYIVEFIIKKLSQKKQMPDYNPLGFVPDGSEDYDDSENCEHTFMPIDSTNEILSCTKCGILKKKKELEKENFFAKNFFTSHNS